MKISSIIVCVIIFILLLNFGNPAAQNINEKRIIKVKEKSENYTISNEIEYWGLIFGVGEYYKHPEENRPFMIEMVQIFPGILLESENWKSDHIHTLKGSQATGINLIKELFWLINNADENDMVLIYITTHGSPLLLNGQPIDLPPVDEDDHADEILIMYHGFQYWFSFISDDCLNFFLNRLKSKNVCLIIDSCYSGGFNDAPYSKTKIFKNNLHIQDIQEYNADMFKKGFIEDISSQNRIVLMSCQEHKLSWGNLFSSYLLSAIYYNLADIFGNNNGINSAEEAFYYADKMVNELGSQDPTILDLFPGEFTLTYVK